MPPKPKSFIVKTTSEVAWVRIKKKGRLGQVYNYQLRPATDFTYCILQVNHQ